MYLDRESVMWQTRTVSFLLPLVLTVLLCSGCQFVQSAFANTTDNAGAAFAAASTTLTYAHSGKITGAYAASSFINFQSELDGLDQKLPSTPGAPSGRVVQRLLGFYKTAIRAVDAPCLNASCDWRGQVAALDRASKAFLEASNS